MNKESNIVIETPVGITDSIIVHEIVIGDEISTHSTPYLPIGAPVYVDDILGIDDRKTVVK